MNREHLRALLDEHKPADPQERWDLEAMRRFALELSQPFSRWQSTAHFTGSAVVVDLAQQRVCLVLHAKLNRWLQPGGHAEDVDEGDLLRTATREAVEETGLEVELFDAAMGPLDVDRHVIPARKDEAEHAHLDVRFLFVAKNPALLRHDPNESHGAKWLTWAEAFALADEPAMKRLLTKAQTAVSRAR